MREAFAINGDRIDSLVSAPSMAPAPASASGGLDA
jgi:hypothetical protein